MLPSACSGLRSLNCHAYIAVDEAIELSSQSDVKHICIIGAGPSGLGALKVIKESPQYKAGLWKPVAFEARDAIGGIW